MANTDNTGEDDTVNTDDVTEGELNESEEHNFEADSSLSNKNTASGSILRWITNGTLNRIEVVRFIIAFFSLVTLHAIFFSLQIESSISNFVDAVFVANVAFRFTMLLVVLLFAYRFIPIILEEIVGSVLRIPIKVWMFLKSMWLIYRKVEFYEPKHLRQELLLIETIEERIDSAEKVPYYSYQVIITIFVTWLIYIDLGSILLALITSFLVTVFCLLAVDRRFRKVSFVRRPDYISVWYGRQTPGKIPLAQLYSSNQQVWEALFGAYVFLSVFSSFTGILRYYYLLNLPPVQANVSATKSIIGNYIGSSADGVLLRDCENELTTFVSFDSLILINSEDKSNFDEVVCSYRPISIFGLR